MAMVCVVCCVLCVLCVLCVVGFQTQQSDFKPLCCVAETTHGPISNFSPVQREQNCSCTMVLRGTKKNERQGGITVWRCTCRMSAKCSAVLWTKNNDGIWECVNKTGHTHDVDPNLLIRVRAASSVRLAANTLAEGVQNIVAETVGNVPLEDHVALSERNLRRTVYSARKRARNADEDEGNYSSLETLVLPRAMLDNRGESILLHDSGIGPDRILALGVSRHVRMLERSSIILGDGTFQVAPSLWKQQYTLHANVEGFCFPVIFFLLPGKKKNSTIKSCAFCKTLCQMWHRRCGFLILRRVC